MRRPVGLRQPARPDMRCAAPRGAQALRRWRRRVSRIRERKRRVEEAEQRRVRRLERQIGVEPSAQQVPPQPCALLIRKSSFLSSEVFTGPLARSELGSVSMWACPPAGVQDFPSERRADYQVRCSGKIQRPALVTRYHQRPAWPALSMAWVAGCTPVRICSA